MHTQKKVKELCTNISTYFMLCFRPLSALRCLYFFQTFVTFLAVKFTYRRCKSWCKITEIATCLFWETLLVTLFVPDRINYWNVLFSVDSHLHFKSRSITQVSNHDVHYAPPLNFRNDVYYVLFFFVSLFLLSFLFPHIFRLLLVLFDGSRCYLASVIYIKTCS
jgi:hypothetical protein